MNTLLGKDPRLGLPESKVLNQLGPTQRYPVHLLNISFFFILGSVAAIFPAAVSQGAQSSQAPWRRQQTVDRRKHIKKGNQYLT